MLIITSVKMLKINFKENMEPLINYTGYFSVLILYYLNQYFFINNSLPFLLFFEDYFTSIIESSIISIETIIIITIVIIVNLITIII